MLVDILGAEYSIVEASEQDEARLKDCDGFCDWTAKEIVVEREINGNLYDMESYIRKVKRHEIVHAFLFESGLAHSSKWATNEELVDWIAFQAEKIIKAWQEVGALRSENNVE